ncbi:hypothetical protein GCM10009679_73390 [Saccharothrix algeriensis]
MAYGLHCVAGSAEEERNRARTSKSRPGGSSACPASEPSKCPLPRCACSRVAPCTHWPDQTRSTGAGATDQISQSLHACVSCTSGSANGCASMCTSAPLSSWPSTDGSLISGGSGATDGAWEEAGPANETSPATATTTAVSTASTATVTLRAFMTGPRLRTTKRPRQATRVKRNLSP